MSDKRATKSTRCIRPRAQKVKEACNNANFNKMNEIEKELKGYINGAERMSGFDSYDSAEGDMSSFDDDDMSYSAMDDDMSNACGPDSVNTQSEPYIVQYQNTTTTATTAIFMGFNDYGYLGVAEGLGGAYGNPTSIVVTNLQTGTTAGYGRLIAQSNNKNFHIKKWRFQSTTSTQLQQTIQINYVDANGNKTVKPFNMSVLKDLYQQITDAIDCTKPINFDGNTFLQIPIPASATLVMSAYPTMILSGKAVLNGGSALNRSRAPRLSGKNVAPVIIQTTQDVKGIKG